MCIRDRNSAVQDTRHWYGAIDSAAAKEAGVPATDKAKLLSEISRYASGKCDQRVVKTWINESAAMHDFKMCIRDRPRCLLPICLAPRAMACGIPAAPNSSRFLPR